MRCSGLGSGRQHAGHHLSTPLQPARSPTRLPTTRPPARPRSKFTQFLLFYLTSKDPAGCGQSLVQLLLAKLRDGRQPPITRCAAAAYLASYLARCGRLPTPTVLAALQQLADCCSSYAGSVGQLQRSGSGGGLAAAAAAAAGGEDLVQRHQVFYAMVQGLLYVLCYHMGGCLASGARRPARAGLLPAACCFAPAAPAGSSWMGDAAALLARLQCGWAALTCSRCCCPPPAAGPGTPEAQAVSQLVREQLAPLLSHWLSPLRACLPSVASEFSTQAVALGLMDCSSLMQQVCVHACMHARWLRQHPGRCRCCCSCPASKGSCRLPPPAVPACAHIADPCPCACGASPPRSSRRATPARARSGRWRCSSPSTPTCCAALRRTCS